MPRASKTSFVATTALLAIVVTSPVLTEETGSDRAVRIIDPVGDPVPEQPRENVVSPASLPDLGTVKIANPAGLAIDILPGAELPVGSRVRFRVSSRRPGYLVLVSIDASGRLTQIYPNPRSLWVADTRMQSNHIAAGQAKMIPDESNPFAGFEFVASPPAGIASVIAILSDRPVQIIDLPDIPAQFVGRAEALKYLAEVTNELRIAQADDRLQSAQWSFDAKFYRIR